MKNSIIILCSVILFILLIGNVGAAPITYTDRTSWEGDLATSPDFFINFNSYTLDASFASTPLDVGPFTMGQVGPGSGLNLVDTTPFAVIPPNNSVDGTPHLAIFVQDPTTVTMTFDVPIYGWFGDFYAAGNTSLLKMTLIGDSVSNTLSVPGIGNGFQSFGFIDSAVAYNQIVFNNSVNDGFHLDNIAGFNGSASVPEPTTMLLLGSCLIGLAGFRKKFKK